MKKTFFTCFAAGLLSVPAVGQLQLVELWEAKNLPVPESVLYSKSDKVLYVSLIDGDASAKDGKGGIALLNLDGTVKNRDWVTGMDAPKGLAIHKDLLYVADIDKVAVVDKVTANVIEEITFPGATFLNDVTVDDNGVVYVSDTRQNKIFVMKNNKPSVFLENTPNVNGLRFVDGHLYALVGGGELWKIDRQKKKTVIAKGFELDGDGLEPVGNGDFLATCWGGLIYYVRADGSVEKMLDVRGKMSTADLGYDPESRTLYIPTFGRNSVMAFQLR